MCAINVVIHRYYQDEFEDVLKNMSLRQNGNFTVYTLSGVDFPYESNYTVNKSVLRTYVICDVAAYYILYKIPHHMIASETFLVHNSNYSTYIH